MSEWSAILEAVFPWYSSDGGFRIVLLDWLIFTAVPFLILWVTAHLLVRRHRRRLEAGEAQKTLPVVLTRAPVAEDSGRARFVWSSVVISHAAVRSLPVLWRRLVGGRIGALERMLERGRREAVLRLRKAAHAQGCDCVIGVRFAAQGIGIGSDGGFLGVEILAYGTGLATADQPNRPVT